MSLPGDPKPRMPLVLKVFIAALAVCAGCLILALIGILAANQSQQNQSEPSAPPSVAPSAPDPVATKQPLVRFVPSDYPCSKNLYEVRHRIAEGADLATIDQSDPDTTAYCRKIQQAVNHLPTIEAKVNHLLVEYCKIESVEQYDNDVAGMYDAEHPDPHVINLQDIYGSLYGTVLVRYDKTADDYSVDWVQSPTNGRPAYFVEGQPSLEPLANRYCPPPAPSPLPQAGTAQG